MCTACLQMTVNTGVRYFFGLHNYCYNDLQNLARLTYLGYITQRPAEAVGRYMKAMTTVPRKRQGKKLSVAVCSRLVRVSIQRPLLVGWLLQCR